jgi:hypothetical protein
MVGLALTVGLVLAACRWGDYEGDVLGEKVKLTLSSGHKWELYVGGELSDKGTYKGSGKTITFTSDYDGATFEGTKKGKKITVTYYGLEFSLSKSVDGKAPISVGDVIDIEFADDFDDDSFFEE